MRIGIDGHFLGSQLGGNETQTVSLLRSLIDLAPEHTFVTIYTHSDFQPKDLANRKNAVFHQLYPSNAIWRQFGGLGFTSIRFQLDVLLCQYWAPFFYPRERLVVIIHDVGHRYYPEHFTFRQWLKLESAISMSTHRAKRIITDSDFSKRTIVQSYGVPPERVIVIPLGVDKAFFRTTTKQETERVIRRLGLPSDYILYIGNLMPRKNITGLIRAYHILKHKYAIPHNLVIVGQKRWMTKEIFDCAHSSGVYQNIFFTGYIPWKDLPAIYTGATLHVLPSLFEGFGITVLESMACGTPVAAANATSIPEVAGDAAVLFDPRNPEDISEKIYSVINDSILYKSLIDRGRRRSDMFPWAKSAQKTLAVIQDI